MTPYEIMCMNLLTGEYNVPKKINQWFSDFLDSFKESEYCALTANLKPWQYKNMMTSTKDDNWNMLSRKQWNVFEKYVHFENETYGYFANFKHKGRTFRIRISSVTGLAIIKISD